MKKQMLTLYLCCFVLVASAFSKSAFAYDDHGYPYNTTSGCTKTCTPDNYGFCQNNCTSYAAYMLNSYGIDFTNSYLQPKGSSWGDAGNWNNAAGNVEGPDIIVDTTPLPGDIAYWEYNWTGDLKNLDDDHGHVNRVEKVYYDSNGNATHIDVTEFNYSNACKFGQRIKIPVNNPSGFIHILAYNEGVTSLYYLDCYEMGNLCGNQTQEEWKRIANKVWNDYRCKGTDCHSKYDLAFINSIASGFGGGSNPTPTPTPTPPTGPYPNLRIYSVGVFDSSDHELNEQKSYLDIGKTYAVKVYPVSEEQDCVKGVSSDTQNVETDIEIKISHEDSDGEWKFLGRVYTQPGTLTKDKPHKETVYFTVPSEAQNKRVYFRAKVDSTKEVHETNEDDNLSYWQKEWYPVKGNTDLIISVAQLVGQKSSITMGTNYRIEMAIRNIGQDTPLVGIQSGYYLKKPGESNFTLIEEDGSDANELTTNRDQWENTPTSGYLPDRTGIHEVKVCADINNAVPETDETNNCKSFSFDVTPAPSTVDFIITGLGLKEGTSIKKGTKVHPWCTVRNIGATTPTTGIRVAYYIDDKYRDDDGIDASELSPGRDQKESVNNDNIKLGDTGTRTLKVCADYQGAVPEINESNNCASMTFKVK